MKNILSNTPRLGIDIGRVLIHGDGPDSSFLGSSDEAAMRAPAMAGAFEAIAELVTTFERQVWLVSKCGPRIEARTRRWLAHQRFHDRTGLRVENVRFCRERRDKAPICAELDIDTFVDDRHDVLAAMAGVVVHRFLFGAVSSRDPGVVPVPTWAEALVAIRSSLTRSSGGRGSEAARAP